MEAIKVKEIIGTNFECEDAILLRNYIENSIDKNVVLDFADINTVPTSFLYCLFTNLINSKGRDFIASHIKIKNLENINDFTRVLLGTAFTDEDTMASLLN
ncbi:STAS-like domain-containing protein [Clostridium sp. 19966]|uniref:STAS-like domain-containing protein n=1 Tax=Clostridium sp. 19966 TaxID=2768166 RepID=UPI0028E05F81|nr:STAS-like domain-containing protein [Clostridium sp. 19966]MDT8716753.1 STAS-like domain-containing protein [Clostridium sp. 19966]